MLEELRVQNYILFQKTSLEFKEHLTAITGETGAGKSLMLGAMNILRGERMVQKRAHDGTKDVRIEATFSLPKEHPIYERLKECDFHPEEGMHIRKVIKPDGTSKTYINDQKTTLTFLKECMGQLFEIHGQRDNFHLLDASYHKEFLTLSSEKLQQLLKEYTKQYTVYQQIQSEYEALQYEEVLDEDQKSFYEQEIEKINRVYLSEEEYETMKKRVEETQHMRQEREHVMGISEQLLPEISERLQSSITILQQLKAKSEHLSDQTKRLESLAIELDDISYELTKQNTSLDDDDFIEHELRVSEMTTLLRKHHYNYEAIREKKTSYESKLYRNTHRVEELELLDTKRTECILQLQQLSKKITSERRVVSKALETKIQNVLKELYMEHTKVRFNIQSKDTFYSDGWDTVELLLSHGKTETYTSLSKVASGGELARIMLALKVVLYEKSDIQTIIFDEIDTGVSGKVSKAIAEQLETLSKTKQVLVITHLPQVAAQAKHHIVLQKEHINDVQISHVTYVEGDARIDEIAKLVSGEDLTKESRAYAKQILKLSKRP